MVSPMIEPKCPVTLERERLGLSRRDLALVTGLSYTDLYKLETGYPTKLSGKVRAAFAAMGVDADALESKYRAWRGTKGRRLLEGARRAS